MKGGLAKSGLTQGVHAMTITINIVRTDKNKPHDKLADAELQFVGGDLDGLKLLGFSIWQQRNGSGQNVTFPARHFTVNGERRNFTLLRCVDDRSAEDRLRQLVLQAFAAESGQSDTGTSA
jgi:hypothetical protein